MLKFAANLTSLFNELPFMDRFGAAKKAGFSAVEYMSPYEFDPKELKERLDLLGLKQVLYSLPVSDWATGGRGLLIFADRKDEFREGFELAIRYDSVLGCEQVNCLSGIVPEGTELRQCHETAVANLKYASAELSRHNIKLLIEPINHFDMPRFFLNSAEQASALISDVGSDNLYIQYDIYHQQRMRGELVATFLKYRHRIAHIQVADNPDRHDPGTGEINFPYVFNALAEAGYIGWIGCEYKPKTATEAGLAWLNND